MPRHRQNSLSASTPGQLQGRGGAEKLRVSRREGMLLSVIVLLAVAICAIALYKTGDPNIPRATGQQRRPGSQRTGDLPGSVSSYTKLSVLLLCLRKHSCRSCISCSGTIARLSVCTLGFMHAAIHFMCSDLYATMLINGGRSMLSSLGLVPLGQNSISGQGSC